MKRVVLACTGAVIVTAMVAIGAFAPAGAAPSRTPSAPSWGASFLDLNNNGIRDGGDKDLASVLGPVGYTGPGGLVFEGTVVVSGEALLNFNVTGNITVRGTLIANGPDAALSFISLGAGTIDVAAGVTIQVNGDIGFASTDAKGYAGTINVGAGAQVSSRGEFQGVSFRADTISVGANAKFTVANGGYNDIGFYANTLSFQPGARFTAPNHGGFSLSSHGDLTLTNAALKAGYINVLSPGHNIVLEDSSIAQTYRHGDFRIEATLGSITLDHTTVSTHEPSPLFQPEPIVR